MKPELKECYYEDGSVKTQYWYLNGKIHREDGPAIIWYYEDGSVQIQEWRLNGKYHREDGPAYIFYNKDGSIKFQEWRLNGKSHREDGPAYIFYNKDGSIKFQEWRIDGKLQETKKEENSDLSALENKIENLKSELKKAEAEYEKAKNNDALVDIVSKIVATKGDKKEIAKMLKEYYETS